MGLRDLFSRKTEVRDTGHTLTDIRRIQLAAEGNNVSELAGLTAAVEIAAGMIQRAFMTAEIAGTDELNAECLGYIGRCLVTHGDCVLYRQNGMLLPVRTVTVTGEPDPRSWIYQVTLNAPSATKTLDVSYDQVLHFRWGINSSRPWEGFSPLGSVIDTQLLGQVVKLLEDECGAPRGSFLPVPKTGGEDDSVELLKGDIKNAKGSPLLVESMSDAWQSGGSGQVNSDWMVKRFGPNPPETLVSLYEKSYMQVLAAFGINPQLLMQGSDTREAWRTFLFGTVSPLANGIMNAYYFHTGNAIRITFSELRSSDLQARARAFGNLTDRKMPLTAAQNLCGLVPNVGNQSN